MTEVKTPYVGRSVFFSFFFQEKFVKVVHLQIHFLQFDFDFYLISPQIHLLNGIQKRPSISKISIANEVRISRF